MIDNVLFHLQHKITDFHQNKCQCRNGKYTKH